MLIQCVHSESNNAKYNKTFILCDDRRNVTKTELKIDKISMLKLGVFCVDCCQSLEKFNKRTVEDPGNLFDNFNCTTFANFITCSEVIFS